MQNVPILLIKEVLSECTDKGAESRQLGLIWNLEVKVQRPHVRVIYAEGDSTYKVHED